MTVGRRRLGAYGEGRAAAHYEADGWTVLARNWRSARGEIDLVVARDRTVAIVEVKTRSGDGFGVPAEAVTPAKQRRLRQLGMEWVQASGRRWDTIRFDVVSVLRGQVEVIQDAF